MNIIVHDYLRRERKREEKKVRWVLGGHLGSPGAPAIFI